MGTTLWTTRPEPLRSCSWARLQVGVEPATSWSQARHPSCCATMQPLRPMSHLRFCRATLTRDSDARQSHSVRLHSRTLRLWRSVIRIARSHVCLSHAASKSQRATMKSYAATLSRVRVARQNRATKSQVWHGTKIQYLWFLRFR